jgi:hypothetical protein
MLHRVLFGLLFSAVLVAANTTARAARLEGAYLESRTCQVYTGPCFANSESGLAGKCAILAWNIAQGDHAGVDLAGLSVVAVVHSSDTLAFEGIDNGRELKSMILVDERATTEQRDALVEFAKQQIGRAGEHVVKVETQPINMSLDVIDLRGKLEVGKVVKLSTRAARVGDCICGNEAAYYPPLARLDHFAAGVCIENEFRGRGLGQRWSAPDSRSAYMGTFVY